MNTDPSQAYEIGDVSLLTHAAAADAARCVPGQLVPSITASWMPLPRFPIVIEVPRQTPSQHATLGVLVCCMSWSNLTFRPGWRSPGPSTRSARSSRPRPTLRQSWPRLVGSHSLCKETAFALCIPLQRHCVRRLFPLPFTAFALCFSTAFHCLSPCLSPLLSWPR